ncbi:uncharacterized protein LY79DRAFT_348843 [Colletotrichum navitas]|uniref:Uncharacterized protein n=1 Tax=Colletotrichum navitas TaxID=681940 RepID=A0AAD8Q901_9PEZI|nr:uncharacterized protein LY79DRAFT_348843 [Colletotrichum navitas]KAK1597566.1 hypothetical protein LY79DRAFT_348843 [Colletotrichum navitas]
MRTGTRAQQCFCFLDLLWHLLLFHYSKMDCSYCSPGGSTELLLHLGTLGNEWWWCGFTLVWSTFSRALRDSCVFAGKRDDTIYRLLVWFSGSGERGYHWGGCSGKEMLKTWKGVQEGRTRLVRSCGAKPARRNAIYDTFISKSVFYPLVSSDALSPCRGCPRGGTEQHLARGRMSLCLDRRRLPDGFYESRYRAGPVGRGDIVFQDKAMTGSRGGVPLTLAAQLASYRSCFLSAPLRP